MSTREIERDRCDSGHLKLPIEMSFSRSSGGFLEVFGHSRYSTKTATNYHGRKTGPDGSLPSCLRKTGKTAEPDVVVDWI